MLARGNWNTWNAPCRRAGRHHPCRHARRQRVLFVEQFRVPLQAATIEMPAGLVGDIHAGESIEVSAIRELEEETGWTAAQAEVLLVGPTSSGMASEKIAFVRATGLTRIGPGGGDGDEDITVHEIPRAQAAYAWLVQDGRRL